MMTVMLIGVPCYEDLCSDWYHASVMSRFKRSLRILRDSLRSCGFVSFFRSHLERRGEGSGLQWRRGGVTPSPYPLFSPA
eukprot:4126126-Prymnesium_polylepis.2